MFDAFCVFHRSCPAKESLPVRFAGSSPPPFPVRLRAETYGPREEARASSPPIDSYLPLKLPIILKIGMKMARTMPPTRNPMTLIMIGSMRLVRLSTVVLTSRS